VAGAVAMGAAATDTSAEASAHQLEFISPTFETCPQYLAKYAPLNSQLPERRPARDSPGRQRLTLLSQTLRPPRTRSDRYLTSPMCVSNFLRSHRPRGPAIARSRRVGSRRAWNCEGSLLRYGHGKTGHLGHLCEGHCKPAPVSQDSFVCEARHLSTVLDPAVRTAKARRFAGVAPSGGPAGIAETAGAIYSTVWPPFSGQKGVRYETTGLLCCRPGLRANG
jgi:hypothetical protein